MRAMATVRQIGNVRPIPDADAIEVADVDGWQVVIKKGEFHPGDSVVYCEIDSWIPTSLAPFLSKEKDPREYNGVKGERLRTVRLRKQLSQGLVLPFEVLALKCAQAVDAAHKFALGEDVSEILGIQKWEPPVDVAPQLAGDQKGSFPSCIPKTDQERVQNIVNLLRFYQVNQIAFEVTEKLEGSSMTVYRLGGEFGVCSRNVDLKETEGNTFWDTARKLNIEDCLHRAGWDNIALQGELIGPGIQGNIYNLSKHEFRVFDIYDVAAGEYLPPYVRQCVVGSLSLPHVPIISSSFSMKHSLEELLEMANGYSDLNPKTLREGLVFKGVHSPNSFKVISNNYLLKKKD